MPDSKQWTTVNTRKIGVYKITSPTGRIYIGQSVDINRRFRTYKRTLAKGQPKLHRSLIKYGVENHLFEVEIECGRDRLDYYEKHFIALYSCVQCGLNASYGGVSSQVFTEETKRKISEKRKGKKHSKETLALLSQKAIGRKFGPMSEEEKAKRKAAYWHNPHNGDLLTKMSIASKGNQHNGKAVKCNITGIVYRTISEASKALQIPTRRLYAKLAGAMNNDTTLFYVN